MDIAGRGLVAGLAELWARHLFETVRSDGGEGFSRFSLWWKQKNQRVEIVGEWGGMVRLRKWVFGDKKRISRGHVGEADTGLLMGIVMAHSHLVAAGQTSESILAAAMISADSEDLRQLLILGQDPR
jgi:hypothetical protein